MGRLIVTTLNIKGAGGKTVPLAQTLKEHKTDILEKCQNLSFGRNV